MFNGHKQFEYTELNTDFNHYVSSLLQYRYTKKFSELSIGDTIKNRYFEDGDLNYPLKAVKVSF